MNILRTLIEFFRLKMEIMENLPFYDHLPWDLIVSSLEGDLSSDQEGRFRRWLTESAANEEIYAALQRIWSEKPAGHPVYREEDAVKSLPLFGWRITKKGVFPTQITHNKVLMWFKRIFPPWE
jgi:hypothetical protein